MDYLRRILNARVYEAAIETPLDHAPLLSSRLGCKVLLKREDLQPVFSFKIRGAYNRIAQLSPEERARGVIAASAGNHAQGVALAAQKFGCEATIVMPTITPKIKTDAVRSRGGKVLLYGDTFDDAREHAINLANEHEQAFIHPYDDPDVIAGQGTIGMELLRQHGDTIHAVFVCIGGGGLIAGVGSYLKALRPDIRIIGVEPQDAACMKAAFDAGAPVDLPSVGLFADGAAVRRAGDETYRVCREVVDDIITVGTDALCAAIKDAFEDTRSILEPAGALAIAGMKAYAEQNRSTDETFIAIASGANMNFDRLRHVAERAELGERREIVFAVQIAEKPGSFRTFCAALGKHSITEFNYRYAKADTAVVFVGIEIEATSERKAFIDNLQQEGLQVTDLTDNEVAKLHLRHLVGGRVADLPDERLFRFVFPERPGALSWFLAHMHPSWNISLFHYRNHGADIGRVLVGIQVPESDNQPFQAFLDELQYPFVEETDNPACSLFLS